jgi:hypothetical protein
MASRRVAAGVLALLVVVALAGCGVPDSGPAVVVSSQAPPGYDSGDSANGRQPVQPDPAGLVAPDDAVRAYLGAAGADPDPRDLARNVRRFFTSDHDGWQPGNPVVVRITGYADDGPAAPQPDHARVTVTGRRIGVLQADGSMAPVTGSTAFTLTLDLWHTTNGDEHSPAWLIDNPPAETLLSTDALAADYDPWDLYFVSPAEPHTLVPDLRYVSRTLASDASRTTVVNWLLKGPSPWLEPAVTTTVPDNTHLRANVTTDDSGTAVVNLTGPAASASNPDLMAAQLCWTLLPSISGLRLEVEGQPLRLPGRHGAVQGAGSWRMLNPASALNVDLAASQQPAYYVQGGKVQRSDSTGSLPQVLSDPNAQQWNQGVVSAALSADSTDVALVRGGGNGPQLVLGHLVQDPRQPRLRPSYDTVTGLGRAGSIGRPSFLPGGQTVLVPVDGGLYAVFGPTQLTRLALPAGLSGPVTSVSVAADGARVALVAGGRLYVVPLVRDGRGVTLAAARQLATDFTNLTEVAWSQEDRLVLGGRGPAGQNTSGGGTSRAGAWELSIDDAALDTLPPIDGNTIPDQLGAFPGDPFTGRLSGHILLAGHNKIYYVYGNVAAGPNNSASKPTGSSPFYPT